MTTFASVEIFTFFPPTTARIVCGENEVVVEILIEKHGKKLGPKRKIPAELKSKMKVPDHLQVIAGKLDDLEKLLAA
jgi:hypothetical protein